MEILTVWRWLRGVELVMQSLVVVVLEIYLGKEYDHQVLTLFKKLLHDAEVLLVFVLACRILTVRIGMAVEKVLLVAVVQLSASDYFRLITLVSFLEEQPQFVGTANAAFTVCEGTFMALGQKERTRNLLVLGCLKCCYVPFLFFERSVQQRDSLVLFLVDDFCVNLCRAHLRMAEKFACSV